MNNTNDAIEVKGTLQFNVKSKENFNFQHVRFGDIHVKPKKPSFLTRLFARNSLKSEISDYEGTKLRYEVATTEKSTENPQKKSQELPSLDELKAAAEVYRQAHPYQKEPERVRDIRDEDRE